MWWIFDSGLDEEAFQEIRDEDKRQIKKWKHQCHSVQKWYVILAEEFGELGKAILEENIKDVIKEATQIATVAIKIAWLTKKRFSLD